MSSTVKVAVREGGTPINFPLEEDGTLLGSRLENYFKEPCGLRFRNYETNTVRGLRFVDGKFYPPQGGWRKCVHFCAGLTNYSKRKAESLELETASKVMRFTAETKPIDLIILGLKQDTTEDHIRECFGKYGELELVSVKRDLKDVSKGFGFIRFATYESQETVMSSDSRFYLVNGHWSEVKIPVSKIKHSAESLLNDNRYLESKIFVGRCATDITPSDLREYFSKYGHVTHVYVPPNRAKPYAFVTFKEHKVAQSLWGEDHTINGNSVNVRPAERADSQQDRNIMPARNINENAASNIIKNGRLNNDLLIQIRDLLENQDADQVSRLSQNHRPCMFTNMLSRKLTVTSLIRILQSQGQQLPALENSTQGGSHFANQEMMMGNRPGYSTGVGFSSNTIHHTEMEHNNMLHEIAIQSSSNLPSSSNSMWCSPYS